jgi:2-polyprenyl-3-methyl-5-hydroxy-6-metoxy-1,4-benzoquinol methylase
MSGSRRVGEEQSYAFGNVLELQRQRLRLLEALLDAGTIRQLEARGVRPGWRCLEVGAGGGSIATWLSSQVGSEGAVVATDLDTTHLRDLSHPNLEVRVHDVVRDDLADGEFDLVHLRLVLAWLSDRSIALQRLVSALKPEGVLVAEEMDFVSVAPDPRVDRESAALFARVVDAHNSILAQRHGFDPGYGRRLAGDLEDAGLVEVECEGRASMWYGGQAGGRVWKLTLEQLGDALVESDLVTEADVDAALELCDDPRLRFLSQLVVTAWGRRPVESTASRTG